MKQLETTLARLGAAHLSKLLGYQTVELLEALDLKTLANTRLAALVIRRLNPEGVLLNKGIRSELLDALKPQEASRLEQSILSKSSSDPYASLAKIQFRSGTPNTNALFEFFECVPPVRLSDNQTDFSVTAIDPSYPLFDYQRRASQEVLKFLSSTTPPRVLLHMPTGSGKTRTAMNVISQFLRDRLSDDDIVVWLAHSEELCDQAAEEFEIAWGKIGDRRLNAYRHFGSHRVKQLGNIKGGILIAGTQLLYQQSLTQQTEFLALSRKTRLIVMDEAHQAVAPTYHHLLNLLAPSRATAILGLSATPGRSLFDAGQDLKLAKFFSKQKVSLQIPGYSDPIDFLQQQGYLAKVDYIPIRAPQGANIELTLKESEELRLGFDLPSRIVDRLATNHIRNLLILRSIMKEADAQRKIIVFGCSVEHAEMLADLLRIKGYRAGSVTSKTPPDLRRKIISQYRDGSEIQILTNFGVLTTGFDAPKTNVAVITRPTQSVVLYSQMTGRATRGPKAGGNSVARVLTVVDAIPGFRSLSEAFTFWEDIWIN
jgi:DNA repair protein RadD